MNTMPGDTPPGVEYVGAPAATDRPMTPEERRVIFASSLGTVFEWYDFYLYGSLAAIIAAHFFSGVNPTAGFRSEEHTSELQSLMRISYAVFCLKKNNTNTK